MYWEKIKGSRIIWYRSLILSVVLVMLFGACQPTPTNSDVLEPSPKTTVTNKPSPAPELPNNILFVGQSWTSANQGLYTHLEGLTASANPPLIIKTSNIIKMGSTLDTFWDTVVDRMSEESFDIVVLHEISYIVLSEEEGSEKFLENFRKYYGNISETGAQAILIMNWDIVAESDVSYEEIIQATNSVGEQINIKIAPVGLAWKRAQEEQPDYELLDPTLVHSNIRGTYLAVLVIYSTIYEQSPIGLTYQPAQLIAGVESLKYKYEEWLMTEEEVEFLQRIAWETVREYHNIEE